MKFHCLKCGNILKKSSPREFSCKKCGFTHYENPFPTTSVLILNDNEEIMLVKRKFPPKKGYWDLPGGFIDLKESGEECTRREIKEELGINLKKILYIGSYPDKYFFQGINWDTLALSYFAKLPKEKIKVSDDISGYKFFKLKEIPFKKLAFKNLGTTIKDYIKIKKSQKNLEVRYRNGLRR